jgi:hypothetical protein
MFAKEEESIYRHSPSLKRDGTLKIAIDEIDAASSKLLGYTPLPSFLVKFHGSTIKGVARLVPASGIADAGPGDEFVVELAHEAVSNFAVLNRDVPPSIVSTSAAGDFKVIGPVSFLSKTASQDIQGVYVAVGDASFALTLEEMGGVLPSIGTMVEFVVHDVSMWDEVI